MVIWDVDTRGVAKVLPAQARCHQSPGLLRVRPGGRGALGGGGPGHASSNVAGAPRPATMLNHMPAPLLAVARLGLRGRR